MAAQAEIALISAFRRRPHGVGCRIQLNGIENQPAKMPKRVD
jgi:hypothetical protein